MWQCDSRVSHRNALLSRHLKHVSPHGNLRTLTATTRSTGMESTGLTILKKIKIKINRPFHQTDLVYIQALTKPLCPPHCDLWHRFLPSRGRPYEGRRTNEGRVEEKSNIQRHTLPGAGGGGGAGLHKIKNKKKPGPMCNHPPTWHRERWLFCVCGSVVDSLNQVHIFWLFRFHRRVLQTQPTLLRLHYKYDLKGLGGKEAVKSLSGSRVSQ